MKTWIIFGLCLCLIHGWAADSSSPPASQAPNAPDMAEMMKKWEESARPGAGHKVLESLAGEWDVDMTLWMGGPGAPPSKSKGTAASKWVLGGRYLQEDFSAQIGDRNMQGMGVTGYDNFKKKYFSTWMDNMSTGFYFSDGIAEEGGKTLVFHGKMDEPMTGEKDKPMKGVVRILSRDKHTFEMHDLSRKDNSKIMEFVYERKK